MGPKTGALVAAAIAVSVLAGRLFDSDWLQSFGAAQPLLPITALAVLLAAVALLWRRELGALLVVGGLVALLDEDGVAVPSAACVVLTGVSLLCLGRRVRAADASALLVALIAGLAVIGYLFGVPELRRGLTSPVAMALPTALAMLALSAGLLTANDGVVVLLRSRGPGGALVRRLAPAAIVLPVALAFASLESERHDVLDARQALAVLAAALIVILLALVLATGRALERVRQREQTIIDATVDAVITLDADGHVREFNAAAERMFGRRRDAVIGKELAPLVIPAAHREAHRRGLAQAIARGEARIVGRPVELTALRADGSAFPAEVTISRLNGDGTAEFVGHVRDITERLAGERAARRLAAVVESSGDAIVAVGLDGAVTGWNAAAERIYGYAREEALGRHIEDLVVPPERRAELPAIGAELMGGLSINAESMHLRRDGSKFPVEATTSLIRDAAGEIAGFSLIARDITERRDLEEQLRQAQKMEAVGQLAGGIAHDFNNLLTVITGYGQLARARLGSGAGASELEAIERAATRAAELTRQLLAFSRRQRLDPVVLDLGDVARGLAPMLRSLIGDDIEVEMRLADELPEVLADAGQIEQVVINLAVNARDAMPEGGTLLVETRAVDDQVCLSVTDTGVGIEPDALSRVFEPFYTTKPVGAGTGLGLASVHGAITQSGGHIDVDSERGRGTSFKVYLPATRAQQDVVTPDRPATDDWLGGDETILLCEDEDGVRALVELVLSGAGYRVLSEGRPSDALQRAAGEPGHIHGLVTDVIMPDMPGPELSRRLGGTRPGLRTLFISGYTADTVRDRGSMPPGSAFLEKPFDRAALLRTLRELLAT